MRRAPVVIKSIILAAGLVMLSVAAQAQFKKPLSSGKSIMQSRDASINIGLFGGPNYTYWYHPTHPNAVDWYLYDYTPQFRMGYFGGLSFELMLFNRFSVSLNSAYCQHNVRMHHIDDHFPSHWDNAQQSIVFTQRTYTLESSYQSIEIRLPLTYYHTLRLNKNIKPFVYLAPSAYYILNGQSSLIKSDLNPGATEPVDLPSEPVAFSDTLRFNYGVAVGLGTQFKISMENYYFLVRFDISANVNLRQTFNQVDLYNEFNYKRYFTDAQATLSFMLPMKKQLKDACYYFKK